jgi:hypothetical protein
MRGKADGSIVLGEMNEVGNINSSSFARFEPFVLEQRLLRHMKYDNS